MHFETIYYTVKYQVLIINMLLKFKVNFPKKKTTKKPKQTKCKKQKNVFDIANEIYYTHEAGFLNDVRLDTDLLRHISAIPSWHPK